jgi:hypothetical protein
MFDRCVDDLVRFVETDGERWFSSFRDPQRILLSSDPAFPNDELTALRESLISGPETDRLQLSCKLLGVKAARLGKPAAD